jgi:VanZ family protein
LAPIVFVVAAALLALEWAQIWLPGRTPEITDAVLAVLMGVLLALVDDTRQPAPHQH